MPNNVLVASASAGTSPLAVTIVGLAGGAVLAVLGWFGKRFAARMDSQDQKLDKIGSSQQTIIETIPVHHRRITDLERGHRRTRKILDRVTWILEDRERTTTATGTTVTTTGPAKMVAGTVTRKAPK
jgi:hypothetical protein